MPEIKLLPKEIFEEFDKGNQYKASLGSRGIAEQTKINERFFVGDQWYGAQCGNERPLVRRNIIKRIGEYKLSSVVAAPVAVNYTADGIPDTVDLEKQKNEVKKQLFSVNMPTEETDIGTETAVDPFKSKLNGAVPGAIESSIIMSAMSDYQSATAERVKFGEHLYQAGKNSYISGTGISYTYWDSNIETGLYADKSQTKPIKGDIACEILDVENVIFGDPNNMDVQSQPYIIISQRKFLYDVKREAKQNHRNPNAIKADEAGVYHINSGDRGESEPTNSKRVTVLTKLWKEWNKDGTGYKLCAIKVTENAVVRPKWDMLIKNYPLAAFQWEKIRSSIYGESEITYLIPNQIAINRELTAGVWATMLAGMPKTIVDGDIVEAEITNEPGQVIKVNAGGQGVAGAVQYLQPPAFATQFQNIVNDIANNTMSDSGANDAALGQVRPDNAAAIIQMREAALRPMQLYQNRYYSFIEDIARIWADFWVNMYGDRSLKIKDRNGTHYVPFHADRYKNLVINAKVDVGASTLWSQAVVIQTLDALHKAGVINNVQYLERLPKGLIPNINGLIEDVKKSTEDAGNQEAMMQAFAEQYPQEYAEFSKLPAEQQQMMMKQIMAGGGNV